MNQQLRIETIGRFLGILLGAVVSIGALMLVAPGTEASPASDIYLVVSAVLLIGVYFGVSKLAERYGRSKARETMQKSRQAGKTRLAEAGLAELPGIGDSPTLFDWKVHDTVQGLLEEGESVLGYASGWVSALDSLFMVTDKGVHIIRVNRDYTAHVKGFHFVFKRDEGIRLKAGPADRNDQRFGFVRRYKVASMAGDQKDLMLLLWLYEPERTGLSNPQNELFEQTLQEMMKADFAEEEAQEAKGLTGMFRSWFGGKRF